MKKIIAIVLAAVMALSLAACGSNTPKKPDDIKTDATPAEIEAVVAKALGDGYLATVDVPEEELFMSALGYLDLTKVKSYVARQAAVTSVDLDTVVIVECEDGYAEEAVAKFNESFAQTISYIRQYPFGVAKVEGARLYQVGNTVIYIIAGAAYDGEDAEAEAKLAADEYRKVDDALKGLFGALPQNLIQMPKN